jgi:hypothetical protein
MASAGISRREKLRAEQQLAELAERKRAALGQLVESTGADALSTEALAGALLEAADTTRRETIEGWCRRGMAFLANRTRIAQPANMN